MRPLALVAEWMILKGEFNNLSRSKLKALLQAVYKAQLIALSVLRVGIRGAASLITL
jgi:hypothetical protein